MKISHPSNLFDNIILTLPTSKSINNRLLVVRELCDEIFDILNTSNSDDTQILTAVLANLETQNNIDIKNAGTCMRFLTALLGLKGGEYELTGSSRMQQRPIKILVDALKSIGADISYLNNDGFPPLKIKGGEISGGEINIRGDVSSQYITALLLIAPKLREGLKLNITGEVYSKPYIKMTLNIMEYFGIKVEENNFSFTIKPQNYIPKKIIVEPDWSGVSYIYSIVSLSKHADVQLNNFHEDSLQGDSVIKDIFLKLGVETNFNEQGMLISKVDIALPTSFDYDFSDCPDIAQTVAVALCGLNVPFILKGLKSLRIKETDRIQALKSELNKLGYAITIDADDNLCWDGDLSTKLDSKVKIATYDDHRMAMAFAPICVKHSIEIENPKVVEKSYPDFWRDLLKMGFIIK